MASGSKKNKNKMLSELFKTEVVTMGEEKNLKVCEIFLRKSLQDLVIIEHVVESIVVGKCN